MRTKGSCSRNVTIVLLLVLLFYICPSDLYAVEPARHIIILNSYHQGLFWTDDEMKGILETLKKADINFDISVEYMDWKNYATYENLAENRDHLKYKYSNKKIDMIITTDNAALEFAMNNRADIFSYAPVVFCGVNESDANKILKDKKRVTGVIEENNPGLTVMAALKINPDISRIYLVYDKSDSGQSTGIMTIKAIQAIDPSIEIVLMDGMKKEEIFEEVSHAQSDSIVISTNYLRDINNDMVGFEYFNRRLSQSSSVPVYSLYEAGIGNGAIGGSVISGQLQGEGAARIVLKVLQGMDISQIPLDRSTTTRMMFDYYELKRFNIDPASLPKGSEIANRPSSLLYDHREIVITVIIIIVLLLVFIIILLYYLSRINLMKEDLSKNNKELSELYDDLSAADAKLRQQFGKLLNMQKSLIASDRRFSLLFEKMRNGFCMVELVFNNEGKIADIRFKNVNPGFYIQMEKSGTNVIEKTWYEVFGYQNRELSIYQKLLETGGTERFESYYPDQDRYYAGSIFAVTENEFGAIFDNITEYKMAIKEVKLLNTGLEQRVRERTNELQMAINELEAFSYTVSHDLKSPLRAIDGYSKIILEDMGSKLDVDSTEMLRNIGKISRDMIDMINKLLQYSTTSRAALNKEEVDIREKILSAFDELRLIHPERDITLVIETGMPNVYVDEILFRQLLQNILSNAIKFTKNREKAIITAGCTITQDKYIFYVKDNGIGFDMEYSGKLFGIFQRLHTDDEFEGSGIGLVTIRKIIEKHGGSVWIEGKVDAGATIYFTLPFSWDDTL